MTGEALLPFTELQFAINVMGESSKTIDAPFLRKQAQVASFPGGKESDNPKELL